MTPHPHGNDERPSWSRARETSYSAAAAGPIESVALAECVGRVLAADVVAEYDLPHYASSAMDGWAVRGNQPWTVSDSPTLGEGECRAIVTGGLVPDGTLGILRSERAEVFESGARTQVRTNGDARPDEPRPGEHIRLAGTEARKGDILIRRGTRLNPAHVALAAGVGVDRLRAFARPRVRVVVTGDEVVGAGVPGAGRVRDSFGPTLPSLVANLGGLVVESRLARDSAGDLADALAGDPTDHDIVVTTGGTGKSGADHLHHVAAGLGVTLLVDGIRVRPGGPSVFGRFPDRRFLVGLPGNPLAAMLALVSLGGPLLASMTGQPSPELQHVRVRDAIAGRPNVDTLIPYRLDDGRAVPAEWTGSGMMRGLADSVGVLVCPSAGLAQDEVAETFVLPW